MESTRWAVVSFEQDPSCVEDALIALRQCPGIDAYSTNDIPGAVREASGVIFVTGTAALRHTGQFVASIRCERPGMAVLVAVSGIDSDSLASLLSAGVYDFVWLPCTESEWTVRLDRALGAMRLVPLDACNAASPQVRGFVYASPACANVAAKLPTIAACDANVLIVGETGTGKEVCAQAIHYLSARSASPWVAVNCGAIPAELVENELFGHVKGAYTTAHAARPGLIREAEGGTLFLDDVDCLPLPAQSKLLRFLQEREYRAVGSNVVAHANVRVIAASNCNLYELSLDGRFRQDLFFRLNVLNVSLPALRDRREDIPILAEYFTQHFAREFSRSIGALTPSAVRKLLAHDWPGNVRELRHVLERAVLLARGPAVMADDIDIDLATPQIALCDDESFRAAKMRVVENFERGYLEQVLTAYRGNVTQAALAAKKNRRAFFELMRKHRIESHRFRAGAS